MLTHFQTDWIKIELPGIFVSMDERKSLGYIRV